MSRILITTDYLRPGDAVDRYLREHGHETIHEPLRGPRDADELVRILDGVDGALVANERLTADVLASSSSLKAIVRTGVGYDSVDVEAASALGILVSNLPGINANAVAEFTIGLMLSASRHLTQLAAGVDRGEWPRTDGHELRGATLGLIGFGAAARAVVPLARAFGMTVVCHSGVGPQIRAEAPEVEFTDLDPLLACADIVSVHTALTPATRHLIDARALALMKPTAIVVNTARGAIIDEDALAAAVGSGDIAGAALDVCEIEPLPADSVLRGIEGITVYSHMAGQTVEARDAAGREGAVELVHALAGQPAFRVNHPTVREFRVPLRVETR
ncbi:phosphoglycerate dehydrogenase [Aeromicrobium sp. YIM 150415]|uniref:phosphoglycerate dehydrogenase n=1 Tax=Aeromicrobium sp. YIM 150415 TaxID=2803912 RepID=UPI001966A3FB|nr:phosphoglycerate dehydrogenase [Aeromicrobium sp. YIM 150415]MBM9461974.1 phosphoglycerate dehydrogenase [Aeromicrobium sp. YIM 150415]